MAGSVSYELRIDTRQLRVLVARTGFRLHDPHSVQRLGEAVRKAGLILQDRARRNVSGFPVVYDGGVFRVVPRTGTLQNAVDMQWPYGTTFACRVFVNGAHTNPGQVPGDPRPARPRPVSEYAAAIEGGHAAIDLKKYLLGKTVPFFGAVAQKARGPYAATGLKPVDPAERGFGSAWRSEALDAKLAAKSKGPMIFTRKGGRSVYGSTRGTAYFIAYRRVGKDGWIVPEAKPRPFMGAATSGTADRIRLMFVKEATDLLMGR